MKGDWAGAGMELASGAASTIPGLGTAASLGIDAALMAKDAASGDFAGGGLITGGKKSVVDDVKINADEGEVVMSNAAGNAFGRDNLMAMNAMAGGNNQPRGGKSYAGGGLVGGDKAKSKQMFKMFGEGMIDAQKANSRDFAKIQSQGMKQYYENEGGFKKMGETLDNFDYGKIAKPYISAGNKIAEGAEAAYAQIAKLTSKAVGDITGSDLKRTEVSKNKTVDNTTNVEFNPLEVKGGIDITLKNSDGSSQKLTPDQIQQLINNSEFQKAIQKMFQDMQPKGPY